MNQMVHETPQSNPTYLESIIVPGKLVELLKSNSILSNWGLEYNSIIDNGAQVLAEALKTNLTLTTLDLQGNKIWYTGLLAFSEAFKTNSTLVT